MLEQRTPDELRAHVKENYVGSNIVFAAAGVDHEEFVKAVRSNFGSLPKFGPNKVRHTRFEFAKGGVLLTLFAKARQECFNQAQVYRR